MSVRKDCFTVTLLNEITWKVSKSKKKKKNINKLSIST